MKKFLAVILCTFSLLLTSTLVSCKYGESRNHNRYGSIALVNGTLYYYSNDNIYKYSSGKSSKVEKADSCYFDITGDQDNITINYHENSSKLTQTPYSSILKDAGQIVYDEEYVYAKYPAGDGKIVIYKINDSSDNDEKLTKVDEIVF